MDISIDSRTVQKGQYFIPVKGKNFNGQDFIDEAMEKGAYILNEDLGEFAKKYRKKLKCQVIAIVGSAGKTTVKDMLDAVLSQQFNTVKTTENQNNEIGVPLTILRANSDTEVLIVEAAIRNPNEMAYLARMIRPTHIVFNNIGLSHIENLGTQKRIAKEKSKMCQKKCQWESDNRVAFINYSSPCHDILKGRADKLGFDILPFQGDTKMDQNINLVYTLSRHLGISDQMIQKGLKDYPRSQHRLEEKQLNGIRVIDDVYNANPDGMIYALEYVRPLKGRKLLVMGDMLELGSYTKDAHQSIVENAINAEVEIIFTFGTHSQHIASDQITVYHAQKREELHDQLRSEIKTGDIVLVKGSRGMEMEKTVHYLEETYVG